MWSIAMKPLSFVGEVRVSLGTDLPPEPLKGVRVDVYKFENDGSGFTFERLNQVPARTDDHGKFDFSDLPVPVEVRWVTSGIYPYDSEEIVNPDSLPNLAFKIFIEAEVLAGGTSQGTQFSDIYDEQQIIDQDWIDDHGERIHVPLEGDDPITIMIPEGNAEATFLVSTLDLPEFDDSDFHFLRVGRATRDEIGELGDDMEEYSGKPGYMTSSDMTTSQQPSFFGGHVDAPFGHVLYIGGVFANNFPNFDGNLYYTISFWEYDGDPDEEFDHEKLENEVQIIDPLYNKKYIFPNGDIPHGKWETIHLGPFDRVTENGDNVKVYKRPNPQQNEYWPWRDLMAIWNSAEAPNGLIVLTIRAYKKISGGEVRGLLQEISMDPSENNHLPLHIDNRRPVPTFLKIRTGYANTDYGTIDNEQELDDCGEISVVPNQTNGNECIVVDYSIEDESGNAHPHVDSYNLGIRYTPKGGLSSTNVNLEPAFMVPDKKKLSDNYANNPQDEPHWKVQDYSSVLVPSSLNGWPPEPEGDVPNPCNQYAAAIYLSCSVRTVNGWGKLFGSPSVSRFVIIKKEGG